jgi:hypothetical protein
MLIAPGLMVLGLMALSAAGSVLAAARAAQPARLRLAHALMALVMLAMVLPHGMTLLPVMLVVLGLAGAASLWQWVVHSDGLPCLLDAAGMGLVLAVLVLAHPQPIVSVLLALLWGISSLWAHGEMALRTRLSPRILLEAATAVTGAAAMGLMAVLMA